MAYFAALAPLVQLLDDIILHNQYPNFPISKQIAVKSLHEKLSCLERLLQDYSSKGDEVTDRVEGRIRDVAYRGQDIIESEISHQIYSVMTTLAGESFSPENMTPVKKINFHRLFSCGKTSLRPQQRSEKLHKMSDHYVQERSKEDVQKQERLEKFIQDLHMVEQEADSIMEEVAVIIESLGNEALLHEHYSQDEDALEKAHVGGNIMVGFDGYLNTIKEQLCRTSSQLQVIPIVGTGGIGKTTLVRKTFDDALITYRFDSYRAWVTVSQDFDEERVLRGFMKSMGMKVAEFYGAEELKEKIYRHLKGRRYFIVIDDLWSNEVWDAVKRIFPNDYNGSRIVLTTRLLDVAQYAGTSGTINQIQYLNEEDSWNLFQRKVFARYHCPSELKAIGKSITRKCGGLPLAIVVIAGVLLNAKTPQEWKEIESNVTTILSKPNEPFSSILSLSYHHLPHQLKVCFLHMGSFPEDYEINISNLIKLWVAEGFLKSTNVSKSLEDVAEECLDNLVKRNLAIVTKIRANGQFKTCILHDLLRDFCRQRAFHEHLFHVEQDEGHWYPRQVENVRHINLYCNLPHGLHQCNSFELVRSIHRYGRTRCSTLHNIKSNSLKLLRVFDVPERTFSLDKEISQMFHLRYLAWQVTNRQVFPPSMSMLQNLQSLIVNIVGDSPMDSLLQIWQMKQLRHVIVTPRVTLPLISLADKNHVQKLEYLQTLLIVESFRFTNQAVDMISNLRKLKIRYIMDGPHDPWELYCLYNLVYLSQLQELKISFKRRHSVPLGNLCYGFAVPHNLRKLSLEGCHFPWKGMTVLGSLQNLHVLRLRWDSFVGEKWEPTEGEFCCLKFLLLDSLNLKYWRVQDFHFPVLEHLKVRRCFGLEIPLGIGDISTLKFIDVYLSKLAENSAIEIQEEQRNLGNDVLQVRIGYR